MRYFQEMNLMINRKMWTMFLKVVNSNHYTLKIPKQKECLEMIKLVFS